MQEEDPQCSHIAVASVNDQPDPHETQTENDEANSAEDEQESPGILAFIGRNLWSTMRDVCVIFVFAVMVTHIVQEAGHSKRRFVMGVAETLPEAAVPRGLLTQPYTWRGQFLNDEFVDDYPSGKVYDAFTEADIHEDVFVLYYAPWDGDSQSARRAFSKVAEIHGKAQVGPIKEVYFASVNCWLPKSDCVKEFSRNNGKGNYRGRGLLQQFPILVYYPKDRRGIQYNGPLAINNLLQFLQSANTPLHHLNSLDQFYDLRVQHGGTAVVAYFPQLFLSEHSRRQYITFLSTAFSMLEFDPSSQLGGFGVVTDPKLAFRLQLNESSIPARITMWNGSSFAYPNKTISTTKLLLQWIKAKVESPIASWIGVAGRKSITLSQNLRKGHGNSLIVFLRNSLSKQYSQGQEALLEASIRYHMCNGTSSNQDALLKKFQERRTGLKCSRKVSECVRDPWFVHNFMSTNDNTCNTLRNLTVVSLPNRQFLSFNDNASVKINAREDERVKESRNSRFQLECLTAINTKDCMTLSQELPITEIDGLGCHDNKTLNFYAVDEETDSYLAESIGLSSTSSNFAIVSLADETVYASADDQTLSEFIQTFHHSPFDLKRLQVSKPVKITSCEKDTSCVEEINSRNFREIAMNPKENVVLLYRTLSCAFCTAASPAAHVFHSVKRILQSSELPVRLVAIDAAANDLPWQFTALSVPTVLFFPAATANRTKSDSRVFPASKPLTVVNVLNFVIANLDQEERLKFAVNTCLADEECTDWANKLQLDNVPSKEILNTIKSRFNAGKKHEEL